MSISMIAIIIEHAGEEPPVFFPGVPMQFAKFGQTGLSVSRIILGTGTFGKQTDESEAHRMLDKVAEAGVNFIDTADIYPPGAEVGTSEIITGRWLADK